MDFNEYEELLNEILKMNNKKRPNIPERVLNKSIENISKGYAEAYKKLYVQLLDSLQENMGVGTSPTQKDLMSVIAQIESQLNQMNQEIASEIKKEIQKNYLSGSVMNIVIAEQITEMAVLQAYIPFTQINSSKAEQLIADTMDDLLFATENTKHSVKIVVRDYFNKHLTLAGLEQKSQKELIQLLTKDLTKQGMSQTIKDKAFIGIIDSAGRRWNLKTYIQTVISTKMSQAYHEGMKDNAVQTGKDLAMVSRKGATDSCRYFEGMIISMTGQSKGYMTYDELKSTGLIFHPHCRHTCYPVGGMHLLHEDDVQIHEKQMANVKGVLREKMKKSKKSKK